jgi:hypothetical protein
MIPPIGAPVIYYSEKHYYGLAAVVAFSSPDCDTIALRVSAPMADDDFSVLDASRELKDVEVCAPGKDPMVGRGFWRALNEPLPEPTAAESYILLRGQRFPSMGGQAVSWSESPVD